MSTSIATIRTRVLVFFPTADTDILDELITRAMSVIKNFCNLQEYPEDTDVDTICVSVVQKMFLLQSKGYLKSRSIEGYSESFVIDATNMIDNLDKIVLQNKYQIHKDYTL